MKRAIEKDLCILGLLTICLIQGCRAKRSVALMEHAKLLCDSATVQLETAAVLLDQLTDMLHETTEELKRCYEQSPPAQHSNDKM